MTEADFLAGLVEHPEELDRWLVLSDFLEDRDDPRAELARLHYELTRPQHDSVGRTQGQRRRQELLDSGLSPICPIREVCGMQFVWCPPGFLTTNDERIFVDGFWMACTPVTQAQWKAVMGANPSHFSGEEDSDHRPVDMVSWHDCQNFCLQMSLESGLTIGLPTEAQWEYACRAGTQTTYWWGDSHARRSEFVWASIDQGHQTRSIKSKKPNPWGLWHMGGNIFEWCWDLSGPDTTCRVLRGGSWHFVAFPIAKSRISDRPSQLREYYGLRVRFR